MSSLLLQRLYFSSLAHCTPDDGNKIYSLNKSRSTSSKNGIPKINKIVFVCKYVLKICSFVAVSSDANSQEDTVPAPEAASATVEDVGGALVGDFVARC